MNSPKSTDLPLQLRQSLRLKDYDYSQPGAYFVTIVAHNRICLFGEIAKGEIVLSKMGRIVQAAWLELPKHYPFINLDEFGVMPNYFHGVVVITDVESVRNLGRGGSVRNLPSFEDAQTRLHPGLPEVMRAFKSFSARRINLLRNIPGAPVWQRSYYDRIIRNEDEWDKIRRYIQANPLNWAQDDENPANL